MLHTTTNMDRSNQQEEENIRPGKGRNGRGQTPIQTAFESLDLRSHLQQRDNSSNALKRNMESQYTPHHNVYPESGKESELEIPPINADIADRSSDKAVAKLDMRGYTESSDLLEKLPPELSLRCIHETLPSDAGYASQLLQLTTVSQRWQAFIISAPTLWSEIHISGSEQDSLATLAIFVHQSGTTPLDLIIRNDVGLEWDGFRSILLPHNQRIHRLRFDGNSSRNTHALDILASLGFLPNLQELSFIGPRTNLSQLQLPRLPLMARITSDIRVNPEFLASQADILPRLSKITIDAALDEIHSALPSFTNLSSLQFSRNSLLTLPDQSSMHFNTGMLPRLRHINHVHGTYSGNLERLLRFTSTQLTQLSLRVPESKVGKLIETLRLLLRLQRLTLYIDVDGNKASPNVGTSSVASRSLRSLAISSNPGPNTKLPNDGGKLHELFSALKGLYQSIDSVSFSGFSVFKDPTCSFLESLVAIDSLSIRNIFGGEHVQRSLSLPSVTSLTLSDPAALALLNVSNLLRLRIPDFFTTMELAGFTLPKLRSLLIEVDGAADFTSTLSFLNYPELQSVNIFTYNWQGAWNLLPLQQLVSITLRGSDSPGNRLCVSLIYQPECCPSLQQLHFSDFIEWDILFLLLERRNLGLQGVKSIERVTLPYVPFAFRKPLDDLFNGRIGNRSFDLPLLLEETRELVCDPSIQGCITCLKNMWPQCSSEVGPAPIHGYRDDAIVFPEYDDPPDVAPSGIKDWFLWRMSLQRRWKESFAKFQLYSWRQHSCIRVDRVINRSHVFVQVT